MSAEISPVRPDGTAFPVQLNNDELKAQLDSVSFEVLRNSATERPFTGEYTDTDKVGV
jgi:peptide-methionine (R)-S-oxide reductase